MTSQCTWMGPFPSPIIFECTVWWIVDPKYMQTKVSVVIFQDNFRFAFISSRLSPANFKLGCQSKCRNISILASLRFYILAQLKQRRDWQLSTPTWLWLISKKIFLKRTVTYFKLKNLKSANTSKAPNSTIILFYVQTNGYGFLFFVLIHLQTPK